MKTDYPIFKDLLKGKTSFETFNNGRYSLNTVYGNVMCEKVDDHYENLITIELECEDDYMFEICGGEPKCDSSSKTYLIKTDMPIVKCTKDGDYGDNDFHLDEYLEEGEVPMKIMLKAMDFDLCEATGGEWYIPGLYSLPQKKRLLKLKELNTHNNKIEWDLWNNKEYFSKLETNDVIKVKDYITANI